MRFCIAISTSHSVLHCVALLLVLPTLCYCQGNTTTSSNNNNDCQRNCTGLDIDLLCASNGKTYNNRCEMGLDACLLGIDLKKEQKGACITPDPEEPVQKGETCEQHKERMMQFRTNDYNTWRVQCNRTRFREMEQAGELTIHDVINCYQPHCDPENEENYSPKQCFSLGGRYTRWCWCSGSEGLNIDGTFTANMNSTYCTMRNSCQYHGKQYKDTDEFPAHHGCGLCQCLDGNVTCFEDFVPDTQGRLNASQLNQLSDLLKHFYFFENSRRNGILYAISRIEDIPEDVWSPIVNQWFDHYDSDGNGVLELNHQEETAFHHHLSDFTSCGDFVDHVSDVIDVDNSTSITRREWNDFFSTYTVTTDDIVTGIGRRSTSDIVLPRRRKSLERRKKFRYVISL